MSKNNKTTLHYRMGGLEYVFLEGVPAKKTRHGDILDAELGIIERMVAAEIVRRGVPIRGAEVRFLRKTLGFSMERFASILGLTAPAILKWERARAKRLNPTNEVSVRALMAENLGVPLEGKFTILLGNPDPPKRLVLRIA